MNEPNVPAATDGLTLFSGARSLGFDVDAACRMLADADKPLGDLIARVGPCRLQVDEWQSPFEALAESIIYQQLSGKAAATIAGRVRALFSPKAFPEPSDLLEATEERLRSAGLSRNKVAALKDLAHHTQMGTVPTPAAMADMPEETIIERLVQIRGIGRWTVEMLLMFRLGRPDVLPVNDLGVRKGFALAYGLPEMPAPKALLAHGERWRPFRTVASWYLWRANDMPGLSTEPGRPRRTADDRAVAADSLS